MTGQRKIDLLFCAVVALLLALVILPSTRFSYIETEICSACGARQYHTRWILGINSSPRLEPSPLTDWIVAHGFTHKHDWRQVSSMGRNVFGTGISAASAGDVPPVLYVSSAKLADFLKSAPDTDVQEFVRTMISNSKEQQERVIKQHLLAK